MSNNPDEIRADIEATRRELGTDVDALADKVSPAKVAERQMDKVKDGLRSAREHVMGSVSDAQDSVWNTVAGAANKTERVVTGNPLAVGLIAVGIGWLAASLIPASDGEKRIASNVKDAAQPIVDDLASTAKEMANDLKAPAQNAFDAVKSSATDAVESMKAEAADAADAVTEQAEAGKAAVQEHTASS
jgi:ElaB/YqjD/DUF883 family membrane-anchored ribosome-binding protein